MHLSFYLVRNPEQVSSFFQLVQNKQNPHSLHWIIHFAATCRNYLWCFKQISNVWSSQEEPFLRASVSDRRTPTETMCPFHRLSLAHSFYPQYFRYFSASENQRENDHHRQEVNNSTLSKITSIFRIISLCVADWILGYFVLMPWQATEAIVDYSLYQHKLKEKAKVSSRLCLSQRNRVS